MIYRPFNTALKLYLAHRFKRIEAIRAHGVGLQRQVEAGLWQNLNRTKYVSQFGANRLDDLPVVEYEDVKPFVDRMLEGETNVLWPGRVDWFSKSSGTTSDRSKYIPVPDELFYDNMISCSWATTSIVYDRWKDARLFAAKSLIMGGSLSGYPNRKEVVIGDVSAILIKRIPALGKPFYTPAPEIAMIQDWDEKIARIIDSTLSEDVVMFGGVPTWNIVLFDKILDFTGKDNILEVWPNLNVYLHGGVSFDPYKEKFKKYLPYDEFTYVEIYNASEGYFAVQDRDEEGMLLLLDNGIYYEFIPIEGIEDPYNNIVPLEGVKEGVIYAIVITTPGGLMRYMPGDTISFISTNPYRIKVVGRTAQYINTFGEEVMVSNTDAALAATCKETGAIIADYTVAPRFFDEKQSAGHEWIIEFDNRPDSLAQFENLLDQKLRAVNSDYDAKRYKDLALKQLTIIPAPVGTFHQWLDSKGKMGGQHKVPRLSNKRKYIDEIAAFIRQR